MQKCKKIIHASVYPSVTSRKPKVDERDGQMYSFMTRSEMECDIKNGRFLEHGEYDGNLYGTKINSIHEVIETAKICILDVNPQVEEASHMYSLFLYVSVPLPCKPPSTFVLQCIQTNYVQLGATEVFSGWAHHQYINKMDLLTISITRWKHSTNLI